MMDQSTRVTNTVTLCPGDVGRTNERQCHLTQNSKRVSSIIWPLCGNRLDSFSRLFYGPLPHCASCFDNECEMCSSGEIKHGDDRFSEFLMWT